MRGYLASVAAVAALVYAGPAAADIVPRSSAPDGTVIARKMGEEVRFIDVSAWRTVDVRQDLLAGDVLRTNAAGQLAILFSDRTQIRLGRNSTLLVKRIGEASDTLLGLQSGSIWGRAQRGGVGLTVETPAAAAAIRGTDWSMTVDADGKTSLIVLEGLVELSNEFGSVSVAEGEAAVAAIGQAPTKVIIVDPDDREQMLFYMTLRGSFGLLPTSTLPSPAMRSERLRIAAIPVERRNAEDWVTLAEAALSYDGRIAAEEALEQARALPLSPAQQARIELIEAMLAGSERRYADAARLFERARPRLDARRRAIAAYGGYFARALADPDRVENPPTVTDGGPYSALAEAYAAGFLKDIKAAIEVLQRAERRYPDDPTLPAARAQFAILIDDREQVKAAIDRSLALDPDDPMALEARGNYRAGFEGDLDGALADLQRAAGLAPGSTTIWNALGLVQGARGAEREAEAALRKAVELDPEDPLSHANLAIHYLDQDRIAEARAEIDTALALDRAFDIALIARGRYHLQTGEMDKAMADLLAGTTANPAYAQGLLLLGSAHYESGERDPAAQAIENADRLDPNDPVTSSFQTAIAIDDYDAEKAIDTAQEALRRSRARGGDYAALSANRDAGSLLNNAFRLQGLDAWGRFYGDAVFDPFAGSALVDQAVSGSPDPFVNDMNFAGNAVEPGVNNSGFSGLFQGLMMSPEMLSGRSRSANLFRRPFLEGSVGGGFVKTGDDWGWTTAAELQGFATSPFPWSFYGQVQARETEEFRQRIDPANTIPFVEFELGLEAISGVGYATARPTPNDRVVAYFDVQDVEDSLLDAIILINDPTSIFDAVTYDRRVKAKAMTGGVGWSHTFGYRNVMNAAVFASKIDQQSREDGFVFAGPFFGTQTIDAATEQQSYQAALNHTIGVGDMTWRYGIEAGTLEASRNQTTTIQFVVPPLPPDVAVEGWDVSLDFARAYVDGIYEVTPDLKLEAGLFATHLGGPLDLQRLEPRLGVAWMPWEGHWLRAGYLRETSAVNLTTLAPIGIVGLQSNQVPLDIGGYSDTFAARWDAEWTDRFFTTVDFQHQEFEALSLVIPGSIYTIDIGEGTLDRASATANLRLGYGFGAFGTVVYSNSENRDPASIGFGQPLPYVPELAARVGLTWVHPSNVKFTLAGTYVGERSGNESGDMLDDYWTADAFLTWEPFDKRFALDLAAYNLFDEDFEVATSTPGWGRSFVGSLKVRF